MHQEGDPMRLSLETFKRSEAPRYAALSYEWTQALASEAIYVDGRRLLIRPNLRDCLEQLQKNRGIWKHFWIDTISIDQSNVNERNEQVRNMADTYHSASCVVAWLGNDTRLDLGLGPERTPYQAQYLVKRMREKDVEKMSNLQPGGLLRKGCKHLGIFDQKKLPEPLRGHAIKLLQLPYWKRRWIIEELRLSRRLCFLWGPFAFDWGTFTAITAYYMYMLPNQEGVDFLWDDHFKISPALAFWGTGGWLILTGRPSQSMPIDKLLLLHHSSLSSDPQDRVFSLLGILPRHEQRILGAFFPDYSMNYWLVALIVCSFLKQNHWQDARRDKRALAGDSVSREEFAKSQAGGLGFSTEEVLNFMDISDEFELPRLRDQGVRASDNDNYAPITPSWRSREKKRYDRRMESLYKEKEDEIFTALRDIRQKFATSDWANYSNAWRYSDTTISTGPLAD